jgi:aldose 1-epimerase
MSRDLRGIAIFAAAALLLVMARGRIAGGAAAAISMAPDSAIEHGARAARATQQAPPVTVFGVPVVTLTRPEDKSAKQPRFVEATILPSAGMNVLELKAYWPGKGVIPVIQSPRMTDAKRMIEYGNDEFNNENFKIGGAILLPYPNRIRGEVSADGKTILVKMGDRTVALPANWHGKNPGARLVAMHGLILGSKFGDVKQENGAEASTVSADLHAGNFGGHWLSDTDVSVRVALRDESLDLEVTAKNVGKELLPMAIGWHPYFNIPSGERGQARLHIPADMRVMVNNYDDVFPRGQLASVAGTPYDFRAAGGAALDGTYMDDGFTDFKRDAEGRAEFEVIDPKADYGLRILALSREIRSVQVYSPLDQTFVAVEPQYNLADPYNKHVWHDLDTGVVWLKPGESTTWHVRLELFVPAEK